VGARDTVTASAHARTQRRRDGTGRDKGEKIIAARMEARRSKYKESSFRRESGRKRTESTREKGAAASYFIRLRRFSLRGNCAVTELGSTEEGLETGKMARNHVGGQTYEELSDERRSVLPKSSFSFQQRRGIRIKKRRPSRKISLSKRK